MKIIKYILLFTSLLLISCEDVLEKEPLDLITDAAVWRDPILIDSYLAMQFNLTTVMVNETSHYMADWGQGSPIDGFGDVTQTEHGYGPLEINNFSDEGKGVWEVSGDGTGLKAGRMNINSNPKPWWENAYYIIRNLNSLIERLPESGLSQDYITETVAQARFLRAFNYFNMVKRYGGVPLITVEQSLNDSEESLFPKRNKEQEIYDFIISECTEIAEDLSDAKKFGRPCKWSALHLKSRVALYAGSIAKYGNVKIDGLVGIAGNADNYFKISHDAAKEIMNSGLYALLDQGDDKVMNFRNIFVTKRHREVIFAKLHNYTDALSGGGATWGYDFVQRPKPHAWDIGMGNAPYLELAEAFEYKDGAPGNLDRTELESKLWSMEELWGDKDPRFYATIWTNETPWRGGKITSHQGLLTPDGTLLRDEKDAYEGIAAWGTQYIFSGNFGTSFGVMKYLDENVDIGVTWSNSGTDYQVFRYGETLLNFAEAAFELGKTGEALDAINQIRNRAGIAQLTSVSLDQIRHERRVELAYEGHRYWDVRRWRTATTELSGAFSGVRYILDYETKKFKIEVIEDIDGPNNRPNFKEEMYYFPISLRRTGQNPNLVENPGY